ncbi:hypothetical protein L484_019315 [Morus notabilis]|uniref:Myb-like domain-containing protein n=1 Tax=Morus notabilis TaxID=981085 RepID=W9QWN1_9ROSA|nr:hypothetical protein L484_019315 [Morus notabilis]
MFVIFEEPYILGRSFYSGSLQENAVNEDLESRVSVNVTNHQRKKRVSQAGDAATYQKVEEENDDSTALSKTKLIWTDELHNKFLQATNELGFDGAYSKEIHLLMNASGLTKENVSSHLQVRFLLKLSLKPYVSFI